MLTVFYFEEPTEVYLFSLPRTALKTPKNYPFSEFNADKREAYIHLSEKNVSPPCKTLEEVVMVVLNHYGTESERERALDAFMPVAVDYNFHEIPSFKGVIFKKYIKKYMTKRYMLN